MAGRLLPFSLLVVLCSVVGTAVNAVLGIVIVVTGTALLWGVKRRDESSRDLVHEREREAPDELSTSPARARVSDRQRDALPAWYLEREVFPVPTWAWVVLAVLTLGPYELGQVHVLSSDHAANGLLIGAGAGALLLVGAGRLERARLRRAARRT